MEKRSFFFFFLLSWDDLRFCQTKWHTHKPCKEWKNSRLLFLLLFPFLVSPQFPCVCLLNDFFIYSLVTVKNVVKQQQNKWLRILFTSLAQGWHGTVLVSLVLIPHSDLSRLHANITTAVFFHLELWAETFYIRKTPVLNDAIKMFYFVSQGRVYLRMLWKLVVLRRDYITVTSRSRGYRVNWSLATQSEKALKTDTTDWDAIFRI